MATCVGGNLNVTGLHVSVRVGCHHKTICRKPNISRTRWTQAVGRQTRWTSNPLDVEAVG
ncbi:predicted protein [Histoplasma mississippiense (nom. inval.)]|uniref:predicted protein n=1 Tax=Ajellomyces capsulatus (strain NAm1 / WU24) TaxID=2059318 RepID=UPI000157C694|nr:predicted protein [Histoplasma mississippiense (nom. inval.)]EDN08370.1 predicted protein [Histoplasma mississippiense (nom. inval.)]